MNPDSSAAAVLNLGKILNINDGMIAVTSQAASQARQRTQAKHAAELRVAALTPPPQRTREQVELLRGFLSTTLLGPLQPTHLLDLAQAMEGVELQQGSVIYRQGDPSHSFYVVLQGHVTMYEVSCDDGAGGTPSCGGCSASQSSAGSHGGSNSSGSGGKCSSAPSISGAARGASTAGSTAACTGGSMSASGSRPRAPGPAVGSSHGISSSAAGATDAPGTQVTPVEKTQGSFARASPNAVPGAGAGSAAKAVLQPVSAFSLPDHVVEVRHVGPREAFGEDDMQTSREYTAVAGCATAATQFVLIEATDTANHKVAVANTYVGVSPSTAEHAAAVLLQLSAADYGAMLEGRLSALLEEKVAFLGTLPALNLSAAYLSSLAHCFHAVSFEPREVLVRQGELADCMYVVKAGQVCVLIDPTLTLGDGSSASASAGTAQPGDSSDIDARRLVQVCLLGSGSIIGDMAMRDAKGGPSRRSATVIALTATHTYACSLREFRRRMPADVLESMRSVASKKLVMNEHKANSRAAAEAAGQDGHVLLGGAAVPEEVLRGRGLRALLDAQQAIGSGGDAACVGGMLAALEAASMAAPPHSSGTGHSPWAVKAGGTSALVNEALTRRGYLVAPPAEFLALLTDWRGAVHGAAAGGGTADRCLPLSHVFPLPLPVHGGAGGLNTATAAGAGCVMGKHKGSSSSSSTWTADTVCMGSASAWVAGSSSSPHSSNSATACCAASSHSTAPLRPMLDELASARKAAADKAAAAPLLQPAGQLVRMPGAADTDVKQQSVLLPASVLKHAVAQLSGSSGGAGVGGAAGGGFRGALSRASPAGSPRSELRGNSGGTREPSLHEASVRAAALFRPGSPIYLQKGVGTIAGGIQRGSGVACASRSGVEPSSPPPAAVSRTLEVLQAVGAHGAGIVLNAEGHAELDFHGAPRRQQPTLGGRLA